MFSAGGFERGMGKLGIRRTHDHLQGRRGKGVRRHKMNQLRKDIKGK